LGQKNRTAVFVGLSVPFITFTTLIVRTRKSFMDVSGTATFDFMALFARKSFTSFSFI